MADNFFGLTDIGQVSSNNEDAFVARKVSDQYLVAAVIDGVGGYEGGEVAASLAQEAILHATSKSITDPEKKLKDAFALANDKIYNEKKKGLQHQNMACVLTAVIADTKNNQFHYAHLGDTRLYLFRDNSLVKITNDHSFVGFLEDSGRLSEDDARFHPKRNEINKALGFDPNLNLQANYIDTGTSPFLPGDMLLLCSDGLTDMISSKEISAILNDEGSLKVKCAALVDAANQSGGKDNITVVLVQNVNKPIEQEATRPLGVPKKNGTGDENGSTADGKEKNKRKRSGRGIIFFLVLMCLLLGGILVWQNRDYFKTKPAAIVAPRPDLTPQEVQLRDSIFYAGDTLVLTDSVFGQAILITDTLIVEKDSIHINGNGIRFRADSAYKGPAISIPINARHVVLENIDFENFSTGINAQSTGLQLRNVRFINCGIPIQYRFAVSPGKYISGSITDSIFSQADSLLKQ